MKIGSSPTRVDITGQRFGQLIAVECVGYDDGGGHAMWRCKCDCGNKKIVRANALRYGKTRSCGCTRYSWHEAHKQTKLKAGLLQTEKWA